MKVKFMNFKEMAITQNTGMCSYLTIAWAVPYILCFCVFARALLATNIRKTFIWLCYQA